VGMRRQRGVKREMQRWPELRAEHPERQRGRRGDDANDARPPRARGPALMAPPHDGTVPRVALTRQARQVRGSERAP
jgi:hypothetical protein